MKRTKFVFVLAAVMVLVFAIGANAQTQLPRIRTIDAGTAGSAIVDLVLHEGIAINPLEGFYYHVSIEDTSLFNANDAVDSDSLIIEVQTRPAIGYPGAINTLNWVGTYRDTITLGGGGRRMATQDGWAGVGSGFCRVMTADSSAAYAFAHSVPQ